MSDQVNASQSQPYTDGSLPVLKDTSAPSAAHSTGEWTVQRGGELMPASERLIVSLLGTNEMGMQMIRTIGKTFGNAGEAEAVANAYVLAAAPDLLTEAREICAILDCYRADTGEEPCFDREAIGEEVARRHDSLTAAICKALAQ